ncbi:MAG: FkbM family methyltransferase [Alphaproteobacteria bacterium]
MKIALNVAYRRVPAVLPYPLRRSKTNSGRPHRSQLGGAGVAWRFQIPSVAALRHRVSRGISAARAPANGGDDTHIWIDERIIGRSSSVREFYEAYFSSGKEKRLIQVGANDGIMCDPLRRFLVESRDQNIAAVLIEPLPYYYERLCHLYRDYPNITVVNVACGGSRGRAPLYFIEPAIADRMNGDGPANNWAHGQGSFDPDVIRYWIERNRFRGEDYISNIDTFIRSITFVDVDVVTLSEIAMSRENDNLLVVIDVQGFELDVIRGIDWDYPPAYIVLEDDLNKAGPIGDYLAVRGYYYLCGRNDKLYVHR